MRSRRFAVTLASALLLVFGASAAYTIAQAAPYCLKCHKNSGCPSGFCYVDCENCCYRDYQYGVICFK